MEISGVLVPAAFGANRRKNVSRETGPHGTRARTRSAASTHAVAASRQWLSQRRETNNPQSYPQQYPPPCTQTGRLGGEFNIAQVQGSADVQHTLGEPAKLPTVCVSPQHRAPLSPTPDRSPRKTITPGTDTQRGGHATDRRKGRWAAAAAAWDVHQGSDDPRSCPQYRLSG
jgi:hypothetical protein